MNNSQELFFFYGKKSMFDDKTRSRWWNTLEEQNVARNG